MTELEEFEASQAGINPALDDFEASQTGFTGSPEGTPAATPPVSEAIRTAALQGLPSVGRGILRGSADMIDSGINAGRNVAAWAQDQPQPEPVAPLGKLVTEYVDPMFAGIDSPTAKASQFAGEMAGPGGAGAGAVKLLAKGATKIAPGAKRLAQTLEMMGAGPAPLPGAGWAANATARTGLGATAGGIQAAVGDADNVPGMALGAATGAVAGPVLHKGGEALVDLNEARQRIFSGGRVEQLRDEALRAAAGPRADDIRLNLAAGGTQGPVQSPRITEGLPAQLANDPGISGVHRYLRANLDNDYDAPVSKFLEKQKGELGLSLEGRSAGLQADRDARDKATEPLFAALNRSTQPVSLKIPAQDSISRILQAADPATGLAGDLQGHNAGKHLVAAAKPLIAPHPDGAPVPGFITKGKGFNQFANAGVLSNIKQNINAMLRPDYMPGPGMTAIDDKGKEVLLRFKSNLDEALNRASPRRGPAAAQNKAANSTYEAMSGPINQKERFQDIYNKANSGALTREQAEQLGTTPLANAIRDVEKEPKLWAQFTPEQQDYLKQLRRESVGNESSLTYGKSATNAAEEAVVPDSLFQASRVSRGWQGKLIQAGVRVGAGRQVSRVEKSIAELMRDPAGVKTLDRILSEINKPSPKASGIWPAGLAQAIQFGEREMMDDD